MDLLDLTYLLLGINPFGGIVTSIPYGLLVQEYSLWFVLLSSPPMAYVQVIAVDLGWGLLMRWGWWRRLLERRRSPRVERLMAGRGGFWATFVTAPVLGPWAVMAFMRYARVPQRRVALPILLSMGVVTLIAVGACVGLRLV